jgi:branched-chain amino acid transport system substrate-binding protein
MLSMTTTRRAVTQLGMFASAAALLPHAADAAEAPVRIGCLYPLSGSSGSSGQASRAAIELAADIVNNPHPDLAKLPLGATAGLPHLGGRKVEAVIADHQGNPATAQSEALRLITQQHVAALFGCYQSSCTLTASAVAERYGIPFLCPESSAPSLTERGFGWFFRTTPIGTDFAAAYSGFLSDVKAHGFKVAQVAVVNENTEYGTSTAAAIIPALSAKGFNIAPHVAYGANSGDVSAQVLQLKAANPDAVIFVSYTSDSILFLKTMHSLGYRPPILIGDDAGFSDSAFITTVGDLAQGTIDRSSFAVGKPGSSSFVVNAMYRTMTGRDMDDNSARAVQGFLALAEAIDRAGSTSPGKIQAALQSQDLRPDQLMIGYNGIKYDSKGQNILAATLLVQLEGTKYVAVWPEKSAAAKLVLPFKGWS